jgi:hydrogenase maturation factor
LSIRKHPIVHDLDAVAFPRGGIRIELTAIGASNREADAYVQGVRRGGVLVLATGSNEQVDHAATIMNTHAAMELAEFAGSRPEGLVCRAKT